MYIPAALIIARQNEKKLSHFFIKIFRKKNQSSHTLINVVLFFIGHMCNRTLNFSVCLCEVKNHILESLKKNGSNSIKSSTASDLNAKFDTNHLMVVVQKLNWL
jgi:hypothetical protein